MEGNHAPRIVLHPLTPAWAAVTLAASQGAVNWDRTRTEVVMFELKFDTDNAAFEDQAEISRILREVADHVDGGCLSNTIRDINGNNVGRFYRTED